MPKSTRPKRKDKPKKPTKDVPLILRRVLPYLARAGCKPAQMLRTLRCVSVTSDSWLQLACVYREPTYIGRHGNGRTALDCKGKLDAAVNAGYRVVGGPRGPES